MYKQFSTFTKQLNLLIHEKNTTQKEICEKTNISTSLMNKYVKGISGCSFSNLILIANALNIEPTELMGYRKENN